MSEEPTSPKSITDIPILERNITRPLHKYITLIMGFHNDVPLSFEDGHLLKALDPEEELYHVEFPSEHGMVKDTPRLYWAKEWRSTNEYYIKTKLAAEERRQVAFNEHDNRKKILKALKQQTGISVDEKLMPVVDTIMKNPLVAKNFGIDLIALKIDLKDVKKQFGIKE